MRRMIGFLMMVGLMVGVVGCGDDDNPVKSNQANQDLLVGTWFDEDGDGAGPEVLLADITSPVTLRSNGTFVDSDGDEGTWSLVGDQLTLTYDDPGFAAFGFTGTLNSVTDTKLTVTDEDGERDVLTRQTNQDLLVGTWLDEDGDPGTFKADGTFVDPEEDKGKWSLVGDQLTITYDDPDLAEFNGTFTITVTDTELTMTDEDGEIAVFTRQT